MRNLKISFAAALAVSSFSVLNAVSLEEAIKGTDISGSLRYRYDTFIESPHGERTTQLHQFDAQTTLKVSVGDGFSVVGTLNYEQDELDGGKIEPAQTRQPFYLKESYLRYDNEDFGTAFSFGRQQLNMIWTDNDNLGGSAGMKGELVNTSINGTKLMAFFVDSVEEDGDFIGEWGEDPVGNGDWTLSQGLFRQNFYGAAVLFDYADSIGIEAGLWYNYIADRANMYAATLAYNLALGEDASWGIEAQYLGNQTLSWLKDAQAGAGYKAGNLYTVATHFEGFGLDAIVGYSHYGKKDAETFNVLEDKGDIITAGEEIQGGDKFGLHGARGENNVIFGGIGYNIADMVRLGVDYVWAQNKANVGNGVADEKTTAQEVVGRIELPYNDKLVFSGFYSYIHEKVKGVEGKTEQNNIRFEARYDF